MIRVLLVDDRAAVRCGLRMRLALEQDVQVVGEAGNSGEALVLAETFVPDVIVVDIEMPGVDAVRSIKQLREAAPESAVVVLTMNGDKDNRARAEEAGAHAFVEKQGGPEGLLQAIRRVVEPSLEPTGAGSNQGEEYRCTRDARRAAAVPSAMRRQSVG
jgi:DNA-binding NarL/FixJ family response regulator